MKGRLVWFMAGLVLSAGAAAADTALDTRLAAIRAAMVEEIPFREERHSQILTRPAVFEGRLRYDRETGVMSKFVDSPDAATMSVDNSHVTVERDGAARRIALRSRPELRALLAGFRGLLEGDTDDLNKHFELDYAETPEVWTLRMIPRSKRLRRHVEIMIVDGTATQVQGICTRMTNGDWQHLTLASPIAGDE